MLRLVADRFVVDVAGGTDQWRWCLLNGSGALVAEHAVSIERASWRWRTFQDLASRLPSLVDAVDRRSSERALVDQIGRWTAAEVLGPIADAIGARAPMTVMVAAPEAEWLARLPLGLALVDGRSLASRRAMFVERVERVEPSDDRLARRPGRRHDRLRVLAVFSLPPAGRPLDLRRERRALEDLVRTLEHDDGAVIDLRVLQYGATVPRLEAALADEEGWDVVHISGHGAPGRLVLEGDDGAPEPVAATDVVRWLTPTKDRIALVSLMACSTAPPLFAQALGGETDPAAEQPVVGEPTAGPGVAAEIARGLGCAVVAMRYPVDDDVAITFDRVLYDRLWRSGAMVSDAVGRAVDEASRGPGASPLVPYTPVLLAPTPADVERRMTPPRRAGIGATSPGPGSLPDEPERFVGRVDVVTRVNAVLADAGPHAAVLLHGLLGVGKTSVALEVAHGQARNFEAVTWFSFRDGTGTDDAAEALRRFADELDRDLDVGLALALEDPAQYAEAVDRLAEAMAARRVLVVVDEADVALSADGTWHDPRWEPLIAAMAGEGQQGRLMVTSMVRPARLPPGMAIETVQPLSSGEAVVLIRQLPKCGELLAAVESEQRGDDAIRVVRAVLDHCGGHPFLLELADVELQKPDVLRQTADALAARERGVDAPVFLEPPRDGSSSGYYEMLRQWGAYYGTATLDSPAQLLLQLLCRMMPVDRSPNIVRACWGTFWDAGDTAEPPPDPDPLLDELVRTGHVHPVPGHAGSGEPERLAIVPPVAEGVVAATSADTLRVIDLTMSAFWGGPLLNAATAEWEGRRGTDVLTLAARRIVPYLVRTGNDEFAAEMADRATRRDQSRTVVAEGLGHLRRLAERSAGSAADLPVRVVLGRLLASVDPSEAERVLAAVEQEAAASGRYDLATDAVGDLANLLRDTGRDADALDAVDRYVVHAERAGFGPWTRLSARSRRLQILRDLGETDEVVSGVADALREMSSLPDPPGEDERVDSWNVGEVLLHLGAGAAEDLADWAAALHFREGALDLKQRRGASELEVARARFGIYGPLCRLGRLDEARQVLEWCRPTFERHGDHRALASCLGALAEVESELGNDDLARHLASAALRYDYAQPSLNPGAVGDGHYSLAAALTGRSIDPTGVAHLVAGTMLRRAIGAGSYAFARNGLSHLLAVGAEPPRHLGDLCEVVERIEGVRFRMVLDDIGVNGDALLAEVLDDARRTPPEQRYARELADWEIELTLLVAAGQGNARAAAHVDDRLRELVLRPGSEEVARCLARIRAGERDLLALTAGVDPRTRVVLERALDALGGRVRVDPTPPSLRRILHGVAAAARRACGSHDAEPLDGTVATAASALDGALTGLAEMEEWRVVVDRLRQLADGDTNLRWDDLDAKQTATLWVAYDLVAGSATNHVPPERDERRAEA